MVIVSFLGNFEPHTPLARTIICGKQQIFNIFINKTWIDNKKTFFKHLFHHSENVLTVYLFVNASLTVVGCFALMIMENEIL